MTHSQLLGSDHSYCQRRIGELEAELRAARDENERLRTDAAKEKQDYRWPEDGSVGWDGVSDCVALLQKQTAIIEQLRAELQAARDRPGQLPDVIEAAYYEGIEDGRQGWYNESGVPNNEQLWIESHAKVQAGRAADAAEEEQ